MCLLATTQPINSSPPPSLFSFSSRLVLLTWSFWQKRKDLWVFLSPIYNELKLDWSIFLVLKERQADRHKNVAFFSPFWMRKFQLVVFFSFELHLLTRGYRDLVFWDEKVSASGVFCSPPRIHMINRPLSDLTSISLYYGRKTCNVSHSLCRFYCWSGQIGPCWGADPLIEIYTSKPFLEDALQWGWWQEAGGMLLSNEISSAAVEVPGDTRWDQPPRPISSTLASPTQLLLITIWRHTTWHTTL